MKRDHFDTDVLIIGGGNAALCAALMAGDRKFNHPIGPETGPQAGPEARPQNLEVP